MNIKKYVLPDNTEIHFAYDEARVGKITLECMDMLVGLIKNSNKVQQELQQDTNCTK